MYMHLIDNDETTHPIAPLHMIFYEVDGRRFYVSAGDLVSVPGGAAHTFTNVSDRPSRQLVLMLPAMDALAFFSGLGKLMAAGRPDMTTLNAYGAPWGVEFLG